MNVLSLFDGMSCGQVALNKLGIKYDNYYASEIDKYAMSVTQHNYPNTIQLGDITKIDCSTLPKIDLLYGGSPCQSFSNAGNGLGFDGKSGLFWEYIRVLEEVKPTYFLLENVKMKKEWKDIITNAMGVEPIEINSSLVSAQKRSRLYWTNIPNITQPEDKHIYLKDIMTTTGDFTYPTQKRLDYIQRKIEKGWLKKDFNDKNTLKSECLLASMYKQMQEFIWKGDDGILRFFSVNEIEELQTIPKDYTKFGYENNKTVNISNTQRLKMIGNGWTSDVIAHIFSFMDIDETFEDNNEELDNFWN